MSVYALLVENTGEALLVALDTDVHLLTPSEADAFEKNADEFVVHRVRVALPHQHDTRLKQALETGAACARQCLQARGLAHDAHGVFVWWTFETTRAIEDESAGLLGACAFAMTRLQQVQPDFVPSAVAATGRVSPSGRVQRVAHLEAKLRAALAFEPTVRLVLYPKEQAGEVQELIAQAYQRGLLLCPVATVDEALSILLRMGDPTAPASLPEALLPSTPILARTAPGQEAIAPASGWTRRQVLLSNLACLLIGALLGGVIGWSLKPDPKRQEKPQPLAVTFTPLCDVTNSLQMWFCRIPAGTLLMGSSEGRPDEQPPHQVHISTAFFVGRYEVTVGQWQALMGTLPAGQPLPLDPTLPVDSVSWDDVQRFITALNAKEQGRATYRLPTEAEWEYAARAGALAPPEHGEPLSPVAWCASNADNHPHPVGTTLKSNPWGLSDMQGNVAEWVQDWYQNTYPTVVRPPRVDPQGPPSGTERVVRGGSWYDPAGECRVTARQHARPHERHRTRGFRLVRLPTPSVP